MHRLLRTHYGSVDLRNRRVRASIGVRERLDAYFAGDLRVLDGPTDTNGTPFQKTVWGMPNAVRAVGLTNGTNPLGIVVPCHRVIGSNGTLTGCGGGLARKSWLLRHEGFPLTKEARLGGGADRQLTLFAQ